MIHNSSVIDKKAKISSKVKIGPFCFIGDGVNPTTAGIHFADRGDVS